MRSDLNWMCAVAMGVASGGVATAGPDWDETIDGGGDAGSLPPAAQVPMTSPGSALDRIIGELESTSAMSLGFGDFQDMYLIFIDDPMAFSASTSSTMGGLATFPTQLWLFDADGFGLLGASSLSPNTTLTNTATDGSGAMVTTPGLYYLAISGLGSDPLDSTGDNLFMFLTASEISGPDGPGGMNMIADWSPGEVTGMYEIVLTGVVFAPGPGALGLLMVAAMAGRRRRSD